MKSFKRVLSFVVLPFAALALSLTSGIVHSHEHEEAVLADDSHKHEDMSPWSTNNSLPSSGSYYLTTDVSISDTLNVTGTLNLCLNGHGIRRTGSGNVITVNGGGELKLYDCSDTPHRYSTSDPKPNGAGIASVNDSLSSNYKTFTGGYITGGCIYGGYQYGAGINLVGDGPKFYMYGGTIIGNQLPSGTTGGGGVCVQDGNKSGGFYMYGGSIIGNYSNYGGGVYVRSGKMELYGGTISENVAHSSNIGGGILVFGGNSSLDIKGGTISNNFATHGGAIEASGDGTVTISGGSFENNIASSKGGALTNQRSDGNTSPAMFNISGSPTFSGNTAGGLANDVYLCNTAVLNLKDALTNETKINVLKASTTGTITGGWSDYMEGEDPADYFVSGNANYLIANIEGEGSIVSSSSIMAAVIDGDKTVNYTDLNTALTNWTDGRTLKLLNDVTGQLSVSSGTKTLDLNNHSLTYTSGSVVIVSGGTLNICDNSVSKTKHYYTPNQTGVATLSGSSYYFEGGYITGGNATDQRGGGLRVLGTGSVVFSSGTIFANKAGWGGGIWSTGSGSVTIEGSASIIGNYSSGDYTSGGGYFMEGSCEVIMTGGSIRHNSSQWSGGGVRDCIQESTGVRFTMTGGEITGNYANNNQGSGFCFDQATTFNIGGTARIINNQGSSDIYIYNNRYLTITSAFTEGAMIGVTLQSGTGSFTSGWSTYMKEGNPADYFVSNAGYGVFVKNNEVIITDHVHSWAYVANGNVITATCEEENCTVLTNPTLTIVAEGKTYDGSAVVATLTPSEDWTEENGLSIPDIVYSGNTNVGKYTASITLGSATASVEFEIIPETSTDVDVSGGVNVDGLDDEINALIEDNPTVNQVSLSMKIEAKEEDTAEKGAEIADLVENQVLCYFDITLEKTLDSVTTAMSETTTVLEIAFPYEKVNKRNIQVYAYHDDEIRTFVESDTKADGTFIVDKDNQLVYVYTRSFSTYAIGYTPYYKLTADLSFGIFDGKVNVTLLDKNGDEAFKLEDVDAHNVKFNEVAMGTYKAIVTWADADVTTSLSFNLSIGPGGVVITPIANS